MIKLLLTCRAAFFIGTAVAAFHASPNCMGVTILNVDGPGTHASFLLVICTLKCLARCFHDLENFSCTGTRLTLDSLDDIDDSEFSEAQLILPTDPRPTSDNVNSQLPKIVRILGIIGQKVGVSADEIEAELEDEPK